MRASVTWMRRGDACRDRVAHRLLRHAIQHRVGRCAGKALTRAVAVDVDVDARAVRRVARQLAQRRHETEVVEHARVHGVREQCAPPPVTASAASRASRRRAASAGSRSSRAALEMLQQRARPASARWSRAARARAPRAHDRQRAMTSAASCAHPRAIGREPIEQHVEHRADAQHLAVGHRRRARRAPPKSPRHTRDAAASRSRIGRSAIDTSMK